MDKPKAWLNAAESMSLTSLLLSKLILVALPIAQIAIGVKYLNECPKQHYIPVYLVVCGVFSILLTLLSWLPCSKKKEEGGTAGMNILSYVWNGLGSAFIFCWFICGNVWVYSIYPPNYNPNVTGEPYCNKTVYLFAFWTITVAYIILGILLVVGCCALICLCVRTARGEGREPVPQA